MDLRPTPQEADFRATAARWLAENHPGPAPENQDANFQWRLDFQRRLYDGGWAGINWPAEYGGRGAGDVEMAIFFEEMGRARCPLPANIIGIILVGPTLIQWGTPEQKADHLAGILSGEQIFCQGFSEPEAGSDLAAVRTTATRVADGWVLNGQKVWTSFAQYSHWGLVLARTDAEAPKHEGMTYFIVDMRQPGVTTRPLRQITNDTEFNEVFFEDAFVPDHKRLGPVGKGWQAALTTLANERSGIVDFLQTQTRNHLEDLIDWVSAHKLDQDPLIVDRLGQLIAEAEALRLTHLRALSAMIRTGHPGPETSLVKWMWSTLSQELTDFAASITGPAGITNTTSWSHEMLRARGNSIEGGTTDIQKNIVAQRLLNLPRS